jgi:hypothetical protein
MICYQVKSHAQKYQEKHPDMKPGNPYPRDIIASAPVITSHRPTGGELAREHFEDSLGNSVAKDHDLSSISSRNDVSPPTIEGFMDPVELPSEARFTSFDNWPAALQDVLRSLYAPVDWNDINEVEVLTNGSRKQLKRSQLMRRRLMKILKEHAAKEWWNGNADDIKEGELHWHILLQIMCSEEHREWREIGTPRTQNEIDDINYVIRLVNGMWVMLANSDYAMKTGRLKTIQEMVWALLAYGISIAQNQLL